MKNPNGPSIEEIDDWNDALADQQAKCLLPPVSLLGAVVEIKMIGYDGRWLVVREEGKKIWVQRPQDFKPKWVWKRYATVIQKPAST